VLALFGLPGCNLLDHNHLGMRLPKAAGKPPKATQSHTKATPKPYQSHTKAIPKPYQSQGNAMELGGPSKDYRRTMRDDWV
jgi:hypothetical protein